MVTGAPKSMLDRIFDPLAECFTPEVARRVLEISIDPAEQDRINGLADKANEGLLTDAERADYEEFIEAADLLAILQAKARLTLDKQSRQ
jgi:hypothetical protein